MSSIWVTSDSEQLKEQMLKLHQHPGVATSTNSEGTQEWRVLIPREVLVEAAAKYLNEVVFREPMVVRALGPMGLDEIAVTCSPVMRELARKGGK